MTEMMMTEDTFLSELSHINISFVLLLHQHKKTLLKHGTSQQPTTLNYSSSSSNHHHSK